MKRFLLPLIVFLVSLSAVAQTVPFPANPGNTNKLENWGYTNVGTNWDTSPFLPFIYNGLHFRLMPPTTVTYNSTTKTWTNAVPGKTYPLILFFHGNGETGTDNNNQLNHGGQRHRDAINSGEFPGFAFYPQAVTYDQAKVILEAMITTLPIDINRIYVHGLSGGGGKTWTFTKTYPTIVAAAFPMSATDATAEQTALLYTAFRESQGGVDTNPSPAQTQPAIDWWNNNGGHMEFFLLPGFGHGTWDAMYARADFFSWFLSYKKNTIMVRYNRNLICPEAVISVDMGFTPGFDAYEWTKDGVTIAGATNANYIATVYGTYSGRIKNRGSWSDYATPVVVGQKGTTNTPPIQTNGLKSIVLPALDGSTTTELTLPTGYQSYSWKNASNTVVSTSMVYTGVPVGTYTASANEFNGCNSIPSAPFKIISSVGPNPPDAIDDFLGYATSVTAVTLGWADKPSPNYNETGFEIYRATASAGPYTLIAITNPDVIGYNDTNLTPNTTYYYQIRPVNQYSAGPASAIIPVLTQVDNSAPTAPGNLVKTGSNANSVNLSWTASTDNVGIFRYDVYKNDIKVVSTTSTTTAVYNLNAGTLYNFKVIARDMTGNNSTPSNLVTLVTGSSGLQYSYYEATTFGPNLPDFTTLQPVATGFTPNVDISVRKRDTNIAMMWTGMINIPVAGSYTFGTNSDDGSKLYIGGYGETYKVVDNDGGHGTQDRTGVKTFASAGLYPIVITYYQGTGGFGMTIFWQNTAAGVVSKSPIPNSAFSSNAPLGGSAPAAPTGLTATAAAFDKINLTWVDASNNEAGFRIYRSTSNTGPFAPVASVGTNVTSFQDTQLTGATTYYYRVTAYGDFGESGLSTEVPRGFTYNYYEASAMTSLTQLGGLAPAKTGTSTWFDITARDRNENMAIRWTGQINIPVAATYTFYANSDDGSTVSIDGVQVVANDTDGALKEKSGTKALTVGWHAIEVSWRKHVSTSSRLTISYARPGVGKSAFTLANAPTWFYGTEINAKTLPIPPVPAAPTGLVASNPQPTTIALNWVDNATDETGYQILRSYKTNGSYVNFKTLPVNSTSFSDQGLFSNGTYFYKVQAIGIAGNSISPEVSQTTANNPPLLTLLSDVAVKFGTVLNLNVLATDLDNDPITFTITGLPTFGSFADHGDGSGVLTFSPSSSQLGQYPIVVTAKDNHNGASVSNFTLTVTDKVAPVILPITDPTVLENKTIALQIQATSDFGDASIHYTFAGLPSFVTPTINGGLASLQISPGYTDSGIYPVDVTVTDNLNSTKKTFIITVTDVDPNTTVYVNIVSSTNAVAPWNNMTGISLANLLDGTGASTTIGTQLLIPANQFLTYNQGAVTGNNTGVFPDKVLQDYFYFGFNGGPETADLKITGLDVTRKYNFSFLGSSTFTGVPDNGSTVYQIGTTAVSLRVQNNKYNVGKIPSIVPAADGSVTVHMTKAAGTPVGYLNGFSFQSLYQDGTVPAAPRSASAALTNSYVTVSWIDAPFNEDGFDVYRSTSATGPFTKIDTKAIPRNSTSYIDSTVVTGTTYYYEVLAYNAYGQSPYSNIASTVLPVLPPKIKITGTLNVAPNAVAMVKVSTSSDAVLTITNAPAFAYLSPSSASSTDIVLLPGTTDPGYYTVTATAINSLGLTTVQNFTIAVTESALYRIYVNFDGTTAATTPWNNNTNKTVPAANDTYALKNDTGAASGVTMILQTAFGGYYNQGAQTGNNSGIVPDAVLKDYYYFGIFGSAVDQYIKITGLGITNKYRFKFIASSTFTNNGNITDNGSTVFTIGAQSASVNVQNNSTQFAIVENVTTNNVGEVVIHLSKGPNTAVGYINGMIIEALPGDPTLFDPSGLVAAGLNKTQVTLNWNDNSPVELGYEIQRSATGVEGSYAAITTTASDVSTYTDTPPVANTLYYYRVRAKTSATPTFSNYTNVATAGTVAFKVYVHIAGDATTDVPAPWNNLSRFGFTGDIFTGFRNDVGIPTGFRMRVVQQVESFNNFATNTGNTGVFPDKVLTSFWYNDAYFPIGIYVIDGLDQTFNYNFGFLGSIVSASAVNTDFTVGTTTVTNRNNNPANSNTSTVSYIRNIKPDANGEIKFTVKETAGSPYSIFNALTIEGFPSSGGIAGGRVSAAELRTDGNLKQVRYGEATEVTDIYPNPVASEMNVKVVDSSIGNIGYIFFDLTGREVGRGVFSNGDIEANFKIEMQLAPSVYLMKLEYPDGKTEIRKFIKE